MATPMNLASLKFPAKKNLWSVLYSISVDPAGPAALRASHGMHRKILSCAPAGDVRDSEHVWFSTGHGICCKSPRTTHTGNSKLRNFS